MWKCSGDLRRHRSLSRTKLNLDGSIRLLEHAVEHTHPFHLHKCQLVSDQYRLDLPGRLWKKHHGIFDAGSRCNGRIRGGNERLVGFGWDDISDDVKREGQ